VALQLAIAICANAPLAVRESLRIARSAAGFDDPSIRTEAERTQAVLQRSQDYTEGALAFVEKRPAIWTGS
jgi:enoyl-CoA hydratase